MAGLPPGATLLPASGWVRQVLPARAAEPPAGQVPDGRAAARSSGPERSPAAASTPDPLRQRRGQPALRSTTDDRHHPLALPPAPGRARLRSPGSVRREREWRGRFRPVSARFRGSVSATVRVAERARGFPPRSVAASECEKARAWALVSAQGGAGSDLASSSARGSGAVSARRSVAVSESVSEWAGRWRAASPGRSRYRPDPARSGSYSGWASGSAEAGNPAPIVPAGRRDAQRQRERTAAGRRMKVSGS